MLRSIPGLGKRPDGANALTADYTSRDELRFEAHALNERATPRESNTTRISRPLDNPLDTEVDLDGSGRSAPTTAREIPFHGPNLKPERVNAGAHYRPGTAAFGTRRDGEGGKADVQVEDKQHYAVATCLIVVA